MPDETQNFLNNQGLIHNLAVKSEKNAKEHLAIAKELAARQKYGFAYFHLSISLEEVGKAQLCYMKSHPKDVEIKDEWLVDAFKKHPPKRLTVLSQSILHLTNTFEEGVNTRVLQAVLNKDAKHYPPIGPIISAFKKMEKLRNTALYIENDETGPESVTESDYNELLAVCQAANDYSNGFRVYRDWDYRVIHERIKEMLENHQERSEDVTTNTLS